MAETIEQIISELDLKLSYDYAQLDKYVLAKRFIDRISTALYPIHRDRALGEFRQEVIDIEFHAPGMGCGLEDRGITDRYEAMRYGWDEAMDDIATRLPEAEKEGGGE